MQTMVFGQQFLFRLYVIRVFRYTVNRTDFYTLGRVIMSDALGAFIRIYFINFLTLGYCFIRTFWLTYITVDAFIGNH